MDEIIRRAKPIVADFRGNLEPRVHHIAVTFDDGFQSVVDNALPVMRKRNIPMSFFIPTAFLGSKPLWINATNSINNNEKVIDADTLKQLQNELICIGSHTINHQRLTQLSTSEAKQEIFQSKASLEEILLKKINLFSFPHGEYNDEHIKMCREAGYKKIFTITPSINSFSDDEFVIGRVEVSPSDWRLEFKLKILGGYAWMPFASKLKRICRIFVIK